MATSKRPPAKRPARGVDLSVGPNVARVVAVVPTRSAEPIVYSVLVPAAMFADHAAAHAVGELVVCDLAKGIARAVKRARTAVWLVREDAACEAKPKAARRAPPLALYRRPGRVQ